MHLGSWCNELQRLCALPVNTTCYLVVALFIRLVTVNYTRVARVCSGYSRGQVLCYAVSWQMANCKRIAVVRLVVPIHMLVFQVPGETRCGSDRDNTPRT